MTKISLTIAQKLILGFLLIALLVAIVGFFGIHATASVDHAFDAVSSETLPKSAALQDMRFAGVKLIASTKGRIAATSSEVGQEDREIKEAKELFNKALSEFEKLTNAASLEQKNHLENIRGSAEKLFEASGIAITSRDQELVLERGGFETQAQAFLMEVHKALEFEHAQFLVRQGDVESTIATGMTRIISVGALTFVLAVVTGLVISRSISRPISNLTRAAAEISKGNLDARIQKVNSKDEIGQLASSFNQMASQLKTAYGGLEQKVRQRTEEIVERKRTEEELQRTLGRLSRSNKELEQFANIASHDLQEPLRMVSSYTQLLERRYKDKLDSDANEFIGYAVDGAKRMQTQINDLLAYSRVTTQGNSFEATNCSDIFENAVTNLTAVIEESEAIVTRDPLPTLPADASQLVSVFQNLIGNSIKYHGDQPPRIHVSAVESEDEWRFSFKDNGIGIESEFAERIFEIFQRLHSKTKYSGTGIGLAICKKVIERHGGRIWVESEPQKGSTFYFTLPIRNQQEENHGGPVYHENQTNRDLVGGRQPR